MLQSLKHLLNRRVIPSGMEQRNVYLLVVLTSVSAVSVLIMILSFVASEQNISTGILGVIADFHGLLMLFAVVLVSITSFIWSERLSGRLSQQVKENKTLKDLALGFLPRTERIIIKELLQRHEVSQAKISKFPNMTRVKAHRAAKKLEEKGIIYTYKDGNVKKLRLTDTYENLRY